MVDLPPGIVYLAGISPKLVGPPIATYLAGVLSRRYLDVTIPGWALWTAVSLSLPVVFTLKVQWRLFKDKRDAARHGAVIPPYVPSKLPGAIDILLNSRKEAESAYPGEDLGRILQGLGYTATGRLLFENRVFTAEPEYIKVFLATQFEDFEKGAEQREALYPLLGVGVFAVDGDLWKFHRAMTRPFFTRDRVTHFELFERLADDAISQMKARLEEGHAVDFQDVVSRFTLDAATEFLLGHNVKALSEGLPYPHHYVGPGAERQRGSMTETSKFIQSLSTAQDIAAFRMRFGDRWPLISFWKDTLKDHMKVVYDFIDPIVASAIQRKHSSAPAPEKDEETLLENLVNSTEDPIILRDEVMNLLVAGRDTTASLLTFTVYMLAENPEVLRKLREEILTKLGTDRKPTPDDFRNMRYLRAVLNETLRLYPPVPFNIRVPKRPIVLPAKNPGDKPFYIPADTRTPYGTIMMHRRTDLWGPDALEFDPDRFLDERLHKYLTPNPFIFLPFNAGPRICLGQQFAYNEASYFLVRLLQTFSSFTLHRESQPPDSLPPPEWATSANPRIRQEKIKPRSHLTLYSQGGLWIKAR